MNTNSKIIILHSYGDMVRSDLLIRTAVMALRNRTNQLSCTGKGSNTEEAINNLYERVRAMLLAYVDMIEDNC